MLYKTWLGRALQPAFLAGVSWLAAFCSPEESDWIRITVEGVIQLSVPSGEDGSWAVEIPVSSNVIGDVRITAQCGVDATGWNYAPTSVTIALEGDLGSVPEPQLMLSHPTVSVGYVLNVYVWAASRRSRSRLANSPSQPLQTPMVGGPHSVSDELLADSDALSDAITMLSVKKPHLPSRTTRGDLGQGSNGATAATLIWSHCCGSEHRSTMKYKYRTFTVDQVHERDIDLDVDATFDEWQEDGWEYLSGPVVVCGGYLFMVRKEVPSTKRVSIDELQERVKAKAPSVYETRGVDTV